MSCNFMTHEIRSHVELELHEYTECILRICGPTSPRVFAFLEGVEASRQVLR
jgi:hypothetical protein